MNALATIKPAAPAVGFDAWLDEGRGLAAERVAVDWRLSAWLERGNAEGHLTQAGFDFLSDNLGIAPKRLKAVIAVVEAFPPHMRDETLSIDHHASALALPADERLSILKRAGAEHWTPEETRSEALKVQARLGQRQFFDRDDPEHDLLMAITRAWNRANPTVREEFIELARESDLGVIDA
ncbi:hypothetical protein [Sphingomonas montanisoli]|uniref:DUF222 domain-containing protein n=1 Tax=Sphingomonas montanisoli TaxID=2606412 RepID=A0A5D9C1R2_9SPHN|nr:hypothetical protein [Sphingomonas montanisoli]TZG25596.1 hypothetical protein FYJ91_11255 [Sphingomonas montanisoli]